MEGAPFISICIPAFRRKENLKRLLDSIDIQNFRHFEVVITDDSPYNELQQLIETHSLGSKIRYFKNPTTMGSPENWNQGLRMARADWIKIMHDDDWFASPESLLHFAEAIEKGKASFYFSAFTNVFPNGRHEMKKINARGLSSLTNYPEILFVSNRIGPPSAVIFKKNELVFFDNRMKWLVDVDFYIRYLKLFGPPVNISGSLILIGINDSQITQSSFGNPNVEIPERFLLNSKLDKNAIRHLPIFDSWWRFIRNLRICSVSQIGNSGYDGEIPDFIPRMINFQNKIPPSVLKIGIFSKCFMTICYLSMKKHIY